MYALLHLFLSLSVSVSLSLCGADYEGEVYIPLVCVRMCACAYRYLHMFIHKQLFKFSTSVRRRRRRRASRTSIRATFRTRVRPYTVRAIAFFWTINTTWFALSLVAQVTNLCNHYHLVCGARNPIYGVACETHAHMIKPSKEHSKKRVYGVCVCAARARACINACVCV